MRSIPNVRPAIERVPGLMALPALTEDTLWMLTFGPNENGAALPASKSAVTWEGALSCPGATSANSSSRLQGFLDRPDHVPHVAALRPGGADLDAERGRQLARHRHLSRHP